MQETLQEEYEDEDEYYADEKDDDYGRDGYGGYSGPGQRRRRRFPPPRFPRFPVPRRQPPPPPPPPPPPTRGWPYSRPYQPPAARPVFPRAYFPSYGNGLAYPRPSPYGAYGAYGGPY